MARKILGWLALLVLALLLVLVLARNWIAREAANAVIRKMYVETGFTMRIGEIKVGVFGHELEMRDVKILNPAGFEEREFMDMPEFRMAFQPFSVWRRPARVTDMTLVIDKVILVTRANGDTNMRRMMSAGSLSWKDCLVGRLSLRVGQVISRKYAQGGQLVEENIIEVKPTSAHKQVHGSAGIMFAIMQTLILNGRTMKAETGESPARTGASLLRKGLSTMSEALQSGGAAKNAPLPPEPDTPPGTGAAR